MLKRRSLLAAAAATLFCGCMPQPSRPSAGAPAASQPEVEQLLARVRDRLLLMHDVARWKWNAGRPVADPLREQELLSRIGNRAARLQIDGELAREFFAAQVRAARLLQEADFERWQEQGQRQFPQVPDLAGVQRPRIDAASDALLAALSAALPALQTEAGRRALRERAPLVLAGDGITPQVRNEALRPLESLADKQTGALPRGIGLPARRVSSR